MQAIDIVARNRGGRQQQREEQGGPQHFIRRNNSRPFSFDNWNWTGGVISTVDNRRKRYDANTEISF